LTCARPARSVFSSRRRHTRFSRDWSSDVCSSDLYRITKWMVALVILGLLAGIGLHAYSTYKTGLMTVERQCRATVPDKIEVNGVREYFYRYHEILGWRFYKRSEVKTRTFLVSSGGAWSVVGHTDPTWWSLRIKPGEMG